jgi:hypothetical protein
VRVGADVVGVVGVRVGAEVVVVCVIVAEVGVYKMILKIENIIWGRSCSRSKSYNISWSWSRSWIGRWSYSRSLSRSWSAKWSAKWSGSRSRSIMWAYCSWSCSRSKVK